MAPVFGFATAAGCSSRLILFVSCAILLLSLSTKVVSTAWVYDRQTMLLIRSSMWECGDGFTWSGTGEFAAPFVCPSATVVCLRQEEDLIRPVKKRRRKRGKRAGRQVHLKRLLKLGFIVCDSRPSCLRSVFPVVPGTLVPVPWRKPTTGRGVCSVHLRSLPRAPLSASGTPVPLRMGLINARSIANKSLFLSDLFTSKGMDFMLLTETWQRELEYYHLNELCPVDCSFISTPRLTGRGGGLAVVFKKHFICQSMTAGTYSSFELQITKVGRSYTFYCILVYRPPGPAASFLTDFSDFLSSIIKLDRVIIVGDFNIHVDDDSCKNALEFVNITESFNFTQHVSGPTHSKGHTLDLVFSHGLNIDNVCIEDVFVSDHKCILFNLVCNEEPLPAKRRSCSRLINQLTVEKFLAAFDSSTVLISNDVDVCAQAFNDQCTLLLNKVAPIKIRESPSVNTSPWMNDAIRSLRRVCRRTERLWKATQLIVHRLHLKELLVDLNEMIKNARVSYFTNLISACKNNPKAFFETINNIVSPAECIVPVFSNVDCNHFLSHFVDKVRAVRAGIVPSVNPHIVTHQRLSVLDSFCPISLNDIIKLVGSMKPSHSPGDILPTAMKGRQGHYSELPLTNTCEMLLHTLLKHSHINNWKIKRSHTYK